MKESKKIKAVIPMLYVYQPFMKPPKAQMQNSYKTLANGDDVPKKPPGKKQEIEIENKIEKKDNDVKENNLDELVFNSNAESKEPSYEAVLDYAEVQGEKIEGNIKEEFITREKDGKQENNKTTSMNKTNFRNLDLKGKCEYMKIIPYPVAKIRYIFIANDKQYLGYFISKIEGDLLIYSIETKEYLRISYDSLIDITLNGL
ncbi:CotO family spore coat protein [Neobacillus terrae]|uniref:CotO family spore coat protein n=1 Tax=Neobacillus terrae TaxID=3034837 RepID=UPI00140C4D2D|nr:CotO family spore coat protein [Neobacillus terrae]NHM32984.1 hypothetical protein [Neobacillus terrae]